MKNGIIKAIAVRAIQCMKFGLKENKKPQQMLGFKCAGEGTRTPKP